MKKLVAAVVVRLMLAVIFALLVAALKWEYFQWGIARVRIVNTILYPSMIIFTVVLLLSALIHPLRELYKSRVLPLQSAIEKSFGLLKSWFSKQSIQFVFWGLFSVILVGLAWDAGVLQDKDFRFNQISIPWKKLEKRDDARVGVFNLTSIDNNRIDYLKNCVKIVRDMKTVGVKVVIVPLPYFFFDSSGEAEKYVKEIHETGIAVFDITRAPDYFQPVTRSKWGARTGHVGLSLYDHNPFTYRERHVNGVRPFPYEPYPYWREMPDVSLEALRVYYGLPKTQEIRREKSGIVLGDIRFPISDDGKIYAGRLVSTNYRVLPAASFGLPLFGMPKVERKVQYVTPSSSLGKPDIDSGLERYRETFEGKIMIIQWQSLGGVAFDIHFWNTYARILDHLIHSEALVHSGSGSLLIVFVSILGCGLILFRSRFISSVALLLLFCGAIFYGSAWLFQEKGILVDMPAIMAALVVGITVFAVLRLGHEWRFGAGRIAAVPPIQSSVRIPGTLPAGLVFWRRRISFSPVGAAGILILAVVITALVIRGLPGGSSGEPQKEVVYVTSLPTIEVQGVYIPTKQVK